MSASVLFNFGPKIQWNGVELDLKPMTVEQLAEFSSWIEEGLWESHRRSKRFMSKDEWDRKGALLDRDIALHKYEYPEDAFLAALATRPGLIRALTIIFRDSKQPIDADDIQKLVDEMLEKVVAAMAEANKNPSLGQVSPATPVR